MEPLHSSDPARIGDYRLSKRLGAGGMGQVYLAHTASGRGIVIKTIRSELARDQGYRDRFAREAEAARRVGGFHTAQVVDADPHAERPWIATAHIPGPTLARAVLDHGPLVPPPLHVLAMGLAEGLKAVHSCDLVHRDLKPSNIILSGDGPRIIDFGVARPLDDARDMTREGEVFGSLPYMSPEQVDSARVGPASDVFSLGTVLAYAATGTNPFAGASTIETLKRIVGPPPVPVGVDPRVRDLIADCWNHDPGRRPTPDQVLARFDAPDPEDSWPPPHLSGAATHPPAETAPVAHPPLTDPPSPGASTPSPGIVARWEPSAPHHHLPVPMPAAYPVSRRRRTWLRAGLAAALVLVVVGAAVPLLLSPDTEPGRRGEPGGRSATVLTEHDGRVRSVAFSPDGTLLASGSDDTTARLWSAKTGEHLAVLSGHRDWVRSVAFSPDGTLLATGGDDATVHLWDTGTGESTAALSWPGGSSAYILSVAFHPAGDTIAVAGDDGAVELWDTGNGARTASFTGHSGSVNAVAFDPEGGLLATAGDDGTARLWDVGSAQQVASFTGHGNGVNAVAFGPGGGLLATAGNDGTARLWDTGSGDPVAAFSGHDDWVRSVAFGPGGDLLATGGDDDTAILWDVDSATPITVLEDHEDWVRSVAISPNGKTLATAGYDDTVRLRGTG
ncbi:protein kinase domain-containing protein [Nocardiopsis sp. LOL_012]|uniref:WD40 repeat domain-containing serine/threonine protein kinase n=1 Tax=Nocardiopsis sp. LOL_012 TaxID=3345409 RepID=UPI003A897F73